MLFRAENRDFHALKDMPKPNTASSTPPFEVEAALKRLGADLRTARLARNLSIEAAAAKIGVGYRARLPRRPASRVPPSGSMPD